MSTQVEEAQAVDTTLRGVKVPLDNMVRDERIQRPFQITWGEHLVKHFNPMWIGTLEVSDRGDGTYGVIDGWHRRYALRKKGYTEWWCNVHTSLSVPEEAGGFVGLNTNKNVSYLDAFFARATSLDPVAINILRGVEGTGWTIHRSPGPARIQAVRALENLYRANSKDDPEKGVAVINKTLKTLTKAWGTEPDVSAGAIMQGVGMVLSHYEGQVSSNDLAARLARYPGGAAGLQGKARALRETFRASLPNCVAEVVVQAYNSRRSAHRVAEWRSR